MPSTDINGDPLLILSKAEVQTVYSLYSEWLKLYAEKYSESWLVKDVNQLKSKCDKFLEDCRRGR